MRHNEFWLHITPARAYCSRLTYRTYIVVLGATSNGIVLLAHCVYCTHVMITILVLHQSRASHSLSCESCESIITSFESLTTRESNLYRDRSWAQRWALGRRRSSTCTQKATVVLSCQLRSPRRQSSTSGQYFVLALPASS